MSNTKHTPGPWKVFSNALNGGKTIVQTKDGIVKICAISGKDLIRMGGMESAEANAKLIAAAPELLEALRCVVREMNLDEATCADKIFAAIKKATDE